MNEKVRAYMEALMRQRQRFEANNKPDPTFARPLPNPPQADQDKHEDD
jgi:hypothetical protein